MHNYTIVTGQDGFSRRLGTCDGTMANQTYDYRRLKLQEGDRVLDLGAHIGHYSRWALRFPIAELICVEPHPSNLEVLRLNVADPRVRIVEGAVHDFTPDDTVDFYFNDGHAWQNVAGTHADILIINHNRTAMPVRVIRTRDLLDGITVIKCDIEAGEMDIDWAALPPSVRGIAIEWHILPSNQQRAKEIHRGFLDMGFTPILLPPQTFTTKFDGSLNWTVAVYQRG